VGDWVEEFGAVYAAVQKAVCNTCVYAKHLPLQFGIFFLCIIYDFMADLGQSAAPVIFQLFLSEAH
jgi:hypothetical protein